LVKHFELGVFACFFDWQADDPAKQINKSLVRGFFAGQTLNPVKRLLLLHSSLGSLLHS